MSYKLQNECNRIDWEKKRDAATQLTNHLKPIQGMR